jgi:uncharacterized BrkB/YihY/UPF0761 family membrane protein
VGLHVALTALAVVLNSVVFVAAFKLATPRRLTARQVAPGALTAAIAWQLLQSFGGRYVGHVVKHASAPNAVFALVLGLLAFFYLASLTFVICVEINVVRVDHLHPRSLLTPFTDNVQLTRGDEKVYTQAARSQSAKGFEHVDVRFEPPARDAGSATVPEPTDGGSG